MGDTPSVDRCKSDQVDEGRLHGVVDAIGRDASRAAAQQRHQAAGKRHVVRAVPHPQPPMSRLRSSRYAAKRHPTK